MHKLDPKLEHVVETRREPATTPKATLVPCSRQGAISCRLNANVSIAGWLAASLAAPANSSAPAAYASPTAYSASLPADASQIFTFTPTGGQLTLPGVRADSSGLLFSVS